MTATLITNIGELTTNVARAGDPCGTLHDAAVLVRDGVIAWVGPAAASPAPDRARETASPAPAPDRETASPAPDRETASGGRDSGSHVQSRPSDAVSRSRGVGERPRQGADAGGGSGQGARAGTHGGEGTDADGSATRDGVESVRIVDAGGRAVIPGFVDSHTHLVFGGDRADEFEARMAGTPYAAGGIRRTVAATRAATDDELRARLTALVAELHAQGTTTFEVKTGYGLTVHDEERIARLAAEVTPEVTFLGAHVVPDEHAGDRGTYVDLVCGDMLRAVAPHARWIDVFCETGAFDAGETARIVRAGVEAGLRPRLHGNQLGTGPGVRLAVELGAASVDHCTYLADDDVALLAGSDVVATLLPGVEFSTRHPYPDARRLLDAGVTVALASDCNPGSSFTSSMPLMIALAVRELRMTVAEAVWAATAGGARALDRADVGGIAPGMRADLVVLDAPSRVHLAYRPGVPLVHRVYREGVPVR